MKMDIQSVWRQNFAEAANCLANFTSSDQNLDLCVKFSDKVIETLKKGGTIFTCGNGGSHCDAMHFAEELTGRYRNDRRPLPALALGDASHTTCVGNDYGFQYIFSRQIEALGRSGDLLIGFSTSGKSANQIEAFKSAKRKGLETVALLGREGGNLKALADLAIVVPGQTSDRIQELHIKLVHMVIETAERSLFPENY